MKTSILELEHYIQTAINSVSYLATTVEELSKIENTIEPTLSKMVHSINDKGEFALDNPLYPNLTGHGRLVKGKAILREMQISLDLMAYFKVARKLNKDFAWIYYISKNKFLTMYPYIASSKYVWHYENSFKDVWQLALPKNNPNKALFFTPLYVDGAGKGLMTTIGKPVYKNDEFRGTLDIDFTVSVLSQFLDRHNLQDGIYILVNEKSEIIAASGLSEFNDKKVFHLDELTSINLRYDNESVMLEDYTFNMNSLKIAPWKLYYYKDNLSILSKAIIYMLFILLIIILLFKLRRLMLSLETSRKMMKKLATEDALTGLYNKRYFDRQLEKLFTLKIEESRNIGLMMFDIDDFKLINDSFGHPVGDNAIQQVAKILTQTLRSDDIICRYGGDEFIVIFPHITIDNLSAIANKLREKVYSTPLEVGQKSYIFTISIGVTIVDKKLDINVDDSIRRVDKALYEAKKLGKNKVVDLMDINNISKGKQ